MCGVRQVTAALNYMAPMRDKPVYYPYPYDVPEGEIRYNGTFDPRPMTIEDMRPHQDLLSIHEQGFCLIENASAVANFYDDVEVRGAYFPEIEALVAKVTGARRVIVWQYTRRGRDSQTRVRPFERVHIDFSTEAGDGLVRMAAGDEADELIKSPFMMINVWRPIRGPLRDAPLALCDARSMRPADLVPIEHRFPTGATEGYEITFNASHRWFYVPDMQPGEVLLFKTFDSIDQPGRARFAAHTAFQDPTDPSPPPRESIEVRALAFLDG